MPAYDFKCSECETVSEVNRPSGDKSDVSCPECGSVMKRVFSPVGVVFKGSGFHNTDYRAKPAKETPAKPCEKKNDSSSACASCPASKSD